MEKKTSKNKIISKIFLIICICIFLFSSYKIFTWYQNNNRNKNIKKKTEKSIKVDKKTDKITVDFNSMKSQNKDAIAYLKVKGTNIEYIVVKGKDNDYYLNHNFNREYNESGWVFADYRNTFDDTDRNIIIYAHNTLDGSMFGSLKNTLNENWYNNKENYDVTLITEKGKYTYQVFSVYQIEAEDYYIKTDFSETSFKTFIETIKNRSIHNFNVDVNETDRILTLSTCSLTGNERVVMHAKQLNIVP